MIKISFPDHSVREYDSGITALDIASKISHGLAKEVVSATVNGEIWDVTRPIQQMLPSGCISLMIRRQICFLAFFGSSDGGGFRGFVSRNQIWDRAGH